MGAGRGRWLLAHDWLVVLAYQPSVPARVIVPSSLNGGPQRASQTPGLGVDGVRADEGPTADAHAGPRDQRSGATRPDRIIDRLTIGPIAPTTIRMTPTVEMLMPATWVVTAT